MFGRSKSARFSIVTSSTPGPGEYDVNTSTLTTKKGTFRPVSSGGRESVIPELLGGNGSVRSILDACNASPRPEFEASLKKIGASWTKTFGAGKAPASREDVSTIGTKVGPRTAPSNPPRHAECRTDPAAPAEPEHHRPANGSAGGSTAPSGARRAFSP